MSVSAPSPSAGRAAPVPARWRSTCAVTVVSARPALAALPRPTMSKPKRAWVQCSLHVPGERPFVCLICLSAFTTKANCERHLKVHTDTLSGRWAAGVGWGLWGYTSAPGT